MVWQFTVGWAVWVQILVWVKDYLLQNVQADSGPTQPLIQLVPLFFAGGLSS
jgi:hypothetical protein